MIELVWKEGPKVQFIPGAPKAKRAIHQAQLDLPIFGPGKIVLVPMWHKKYAAHWEAKPGPSITTGKLRYDRRAEKLRDVVEPCAPHFQVYDCWDCEYDLDDLERIVQAWVRSVEEDGARQPPAAKGKRLTWYRAGKLNVRGRRSAQQVWRADIDLPVYGTGFVLVVPIGEDRWEARWWTCDPKGRGRASAIFHGYGPHGESGPAAAKAAAQLWVDDVREKTEEARKTNAARLWAQLR